jgi:hypothetical protein
MTTKPTLFDRIFRSRIIAEFEARLMSTSIELSAYHEFADTQRQIIDGLEAKNEISSRELKEAQDYAESLNRELGSTREDLKAAAECLTRIIAQETASPNATVQRIIRIARGEL